jgi:hypothetical protein
MRGLHLTTYHQQPRQTGTLIRRMSRILLEMIDGGAMKCLFDGELVTDGSRWFVGPTTVNPTAAKQLIELDLVVLSSTDTYRGYQLAESLRRRIENLRSTASEDADSSALEAFCFAQIQEKLVRKTARDGPIGLKGNAS